MAETPAKKAPPKDAHKFSIRETFSSVIIAFAMAFIFRAFVIEAFVIPTGSMAPTLLGQHMEFVGEQTGHRWQVGPWGDPSSGSPAASRVTITDPMTTSDPAALLELGATESRLPADRINAQIDRLRAGDRILVLKYLPILFEPERFD
ncbi:MAG: S26 family signal peptidase, partial [Planctomycetota bacterium]